jgi:purine-binding chemotaxis protein CheW
MSSSIATAARQDGTELFGSFHLGDTELVLPVADVQEVVNYPTVVTQVPLAPSYLLGLFNLRGRLIPIVHLGQLLQLPDGGARENAKIAIVEFRQGRIGLLFDATGEILRVPGEQKVMFSEGEGTSMIGGALKLDGGNRILQILNVDALHQLHDMPIPKAEASISDPARQRAALGQRRQGVSFRVNDTRLALPMGAIHEIIRVPELLKSVLASELCIGMLNLRGNTVPVVDFARFLGLHSTASATTMSGDFDDARRIVVIRQQDMDFGLLVDDVESIVGYRDEELLAIPSFNANRPQLFTGCISRDGAPDIILVNETALLSDATVTELTQGHHELYQIESAAERGNGKRRSGVRETYVTFKLDQLMGMRIDQLREVIDFPPEVMQPPGAPDYVRGILNLRRKLVTIIDLRALYGMKGYADLHGAKVLVVENEEEKFGLIVDAIENIVTIDAGDKLGVPGVLRNQIDQALRNDMREVVELPDHRTLMLLDAAPLKERLSSQMVH